MTLSSFNERLFNSLREVRGERLLVAFSAGKDSLALIDSLLNLCKDLELEVGACYINHGLRESAKNDEEFCKKFCKEHKVPLFIENIASSLKVPGESFEALARKYRYKKLCEVAQREGYSHLLTAHTKNDALETFFLDICQGAALDTLEGIRRRILINGIPVLRPMLEISTNEVEAYLKERGLTPSYDETNADIKYKRNLIRHRVLPIIEENIPNAFKNILKLQRESSLLAEYIDGRIAKRLGSSLRENDGYIIIPVDKFRTLELIEKRRVLSRLFSKSFRFSSALIDDSLNAIDSMRSKRLDLPNDYILEVSYNHIRIMKRAFLKEFFLKKNEAEESLSFNLGIYEYRVAFNGELRKKSLVLRNRRSGDKLGKKRIKDLFINKKMDLFERDSVLIIEDSNKIIFIEAILPNGEIAIEKKEIVG